MEGTHEDRGRTWRLGLGVLAVFAMLLPVLALSPATAGAQTDRLPWEGLGSGAASGAPVGAGFEITDSDMTFILNQLRNMELHLANYTEAEPCAGIFGTDINQVPIGDPTQPIGIRVLDGSCNNLVSAINGTSPDTSRWGASDEPFDLLLTPEYDGAYGSGSTPTIGAGIIDATPREISNLVNDQSADNPAVIAAGGVSFVPPQFGLDGFGNIDPTRELLQIEAVAPDNGLSAPFNDMLTFFGQFFDHGLDLTTKGGEIVMMPLSADDPLYIPGSPTNFMAISRAQDGNDPLNLTTPFIDQNQTYASNPSQQVFLREYGDYDAVNNVLPVTGRLLNPVDGTGSPTGEEGMATWDDLQRNAELNLGFVLDDILITNVPMILTNPYGLFIPGPNGLPQLVVNNPAFPGPGELEFLFIEGDLTTPVNIAAQDFVETGHGFSIDITHYAAPGVVSLNGPGPFNCAVGDMRVPDSGIIDLPATQYDDDGDPCTYDNEMLGAHFQSGDGRVNENLALTAVHAVFHAEHNRLRDQLADRVIELPAGPEKDEWVAGGGEYLFQAAKLINEMEYQHLAFEEFARTVSPLTAVFDSYQTDINPGIVSSFANATYRFGHSMLNENVRRFEQDGTPADLSLVEAFLNPPLFLDLNGGSVTAADGAGALWRGGVTQVGQEIDEFIVDGLRNRLLGLPLDLASINIARGRDNGIPTLNGARAQIEALTSNSAFTPYEDWTDYQFNGLKTRESVVNFIAAYGTHPSITAIDLQAGGTYDERRDAADCLVNGIANGCLAIDVPADRADFMSAAGAYAADLGGLDSVDLWLGALAEKREFDSGSLLGITNDFIFRFQMEKLQEGDRFYYLTRMAGTNLLTSLEGNSLSELVERTTTASNLPADVFSRPDFFFDLSQQVQNPPGAIIDDGNTLEYLEPELLIRDTDGTIEFGPQSISGGEVGNTVGDEHTNWAGSAFNDIIDSGDGDDTLRGNDGDDWIQGDGGGDNIVGGAGDDILLDSSGDDDIKGGPGNDAISGGPGIDLLQGNDGDDLFVPGNDLTVVLAGPGDDLLAPGPTATEAILGNGDDWAEGGNGGDNLAGDDDNPLDIGETAGDDVLIGGDGPDRMEGEAGEDIFKASGPSDGLDRIDGLLGFDWVADAPAADLDNQVGNPPPILEDRFQQTEGLSGTDGDDILFGSGIQPASLGDHALDTATSAIAGIAGIVPGPVFEDGNIILGGAGSDRIMGRGENDILNGDARLDVYLWHVPSSTRFDTIADFQADAFVLPDDPDRMNPGDFDIIREIVDNSSPGDVDTAVFQGPRADYDITVLGPDMIEVDHARGVGGTGVATDDGVDILTGFEILEFTDGNVPARTCAGLLVTVDLGLGLGTIGAGNDVVRGTDGGETIATLEGDDTVCALGGDDTVTSGPGMDTVFGGPGDDILNGQDDDDILHGEGGMDTIFGGLDLGNDTITGGADDDMLLGFGGDDIINGDGGADTIFGGGGNDEVHGGDDDDPNLSGGPGDDTVTGGLGVDLLFGNGGVDIIDAGDGDDTVNGGPGDDTLNGGLGADTIYGVAGADTMNGDAGMDRLFGGPGDDIIDGGADDDMVWSNEGNDTITDPGGVNVLNAGPGDDNITGGADEDTIFGDGTFAQAGMDVIDGGGGADLMFGFAGDDTFNSVDGVVDTVNALGRPGGNNGQPDVDNDTCVGDIADNIFFCENVTRE